MHATPPDPRPAPTGGARHEEAAAPHAVTLEIIRSAFFAIVRQAGRIVLRSSFSPIIRDAFDFCVTLTAPHRPPRLQLDVVAMNESLAHFSGVMPFMVRNLVWEYGLDNLAPGDFIALNNPYKGGNHVYDNGFFKPVFHDGELLGGVALKAHLMDMGGVAAGGYSVQKRNIWEEGVVISGVPVYKQGEPFIPGFNLYFDNTRLPDNMVADLQALHSAATFAEQRLQALARKYGADAVHEAMLYALDYADRSIRDGLRRIPDGDYQGSDGLDADAYNDEPYEIRCSVRKRGERIEVDFSGSSRAAESSINCSAYDTANGVYTALKFLCDPNNPNNSGAFRCVDVVVPEGTFIGALPPAPTTMYFDAAEAVFNAVVKALLPALGEDGIGGHFGTNMGLLVAGHLPDAQGSWRRGRPAHRLPIAETHGIPVKLAYEAAGRRRIFVAPLFALGGFGASADGDGENFVSLSQQNIMDMSVEAIEEDYPILIARKEFVPDTAGPGRHRGGSGIVWDRVVMAPAEVRPLALHLRILPWGCRGGLAGRPGAAWLSPGAAADAAGPPAYRGGVDSAGWAGLEPIAGFFGADGGVASPDEGSWVFGLREFDAQPGTRLRMLTPGGGGWGDPFERDPQLVLDDTRDGFVTLAGALRDYGVVISGDPDGEPERLQVDAAATRAARRARAGV